MGEPTVAWQFAYVLEPAASWKSFGELELQVMVPTGWFTAVTPALDRRGDVLRGQFQGRPAEAVALTVQRPTPSAFWLVRGDRGEPACCYAKISLITRPATSVSRKSRPACR